jgi:hypothetical protein
VVQAQGVESDSDTEARSRSSTTERSRAGSNISLPRMPATSTLRDCQEASGNDPAVAPAVVETGLVVPTTTTTDWEPVRDPAMVRGRAMASAAVEEWQCAGVDMDTGRIYYVHHLTRETVWERPMPGEEPRRVPGEPQPPAAPASQAASTPVPKQPDPCPPSAEGGGSVMEQLSSLLSPPSLEGSSVVAQLGSMLQYGPAAVIEPAGETQWYRVLEGADVGIRSNPAYEPRGQGGVKGGTVFEAMERVSAEGTVFVKLKTGGWLFEEFTNGRQVLEKVHVEQGLFVYRAVVPVAARATACFSSDRTAGLQAGSLLRARLAPPVSAAPHPALPWRGFGCSWVGSAGSERRRGGSLRLGRGRQCSSPLWPSRASGVS